MKIFVIGPSIGYANPWDDCELVDSFEEAEIVLFTGGQDVCPTLYNSEIHRTTYYTQSRDDFEVKMFKESLKYPNVKLRLGICRGAQLFCALHGGKLVQNVNNHAGMPHKMRNAQGEYYNISSLHHQLLYPFELPKEDYEILYYTPTSLSTIYEGDGINWKKEYVEPEVVLFTKTNSLGIQGHPEMMNPNCETVRMLNELIKKLIKNA